MNIQKQYLWKQYPLAWKWVHEHIAQAQLSNRDFALFSEKLLSSAGIRIIDILDHILLPESTLQPQLLIEFGYVEIVPQKQWIHHEALLPMVICCPDDQAHGIACTVESIGHFLLVNGLDAPVEGSLFSRFRRCLISTENSYAFWIVERRFGIDYIPVIESAQYINQYCTTQELWQKRTRNKGKNNTLVAITTLIEYAKTLIPLVGVDCVAYLFFERERLFWQSRNRAAARVKNHFDCLGIGWAAHDHHTYRSSRSCFARLIEFFQLLGFHTREKFYAGKQAGWGAQVMENITLKTTLFLDVDLTEQELDIDFTVQQLPECDGLGTIGMWCALHGDSILESGLHHCAIRSDFNTLSDLLLHENVPTMKPFCDLTYLRQAFTQAEFWQVQPERISHLVQHKQLSKETAQRFSLNGAIASHVEIIQRSDGYKGFNQEKVSTIIKETDPLHY